MRLNKIPAAVILVALFGAAMRVEYWKMPQPKQSIACVQKKTCLPSYNNTGVCLAQRVGTSENELVHQLGQPIGRKDGSLYFEAGATERGPIEVKLDSQRNAIEFICRPSA